MTHPVIEFHNRIGEIYSAKRVHSMDDLDRLVDLYLKHCHEGLERRALQSYADDLQNIGSALTMLDIDFWFKEKAEKDPTHPRHPNIFYMPGSPKVGDDGYRLSFSVALGPAAFQPYHFSFSIEYDDVERMAVRVKGYLAKFDDLSDGFVSLREEAIASMDVDVLPDDFAHDKRYLPRGRLLVAPAGENKYDVFVLSQKPHRDGKILQCRLLGTAHPSFQFEELIDERPLPKNLAGSVVMADVRGQYPLHETILPIFYEKYVWAMRQAG